MIRETSRQSYQEEKRRGLNEAYEEILGALLAGGPMSDREIQDFLKKDEANQIRPRRNELMKMGRIESIEKRSCRITGKKVLIWSIRESRSIQLEFQNVA